MKSIYAGQQAIFSTQHEKEKIAKRPFLAELDLNIITIPDIIDTDCLGTFTGEIPRQGTMTETVLKKARLGLQASQLALAIANEGSFGPHAANPFISMDHEVMVFVDVERQFHVMEFLLTVKTNYAQAYVKSLTEINSFLIQVGFPQHAVIVRPKGVQDAAFIYKGINDINQLTHIINNCIHYSPEGLAQIETDMRAHFNPTRRQVLRELVFKLVRRLQTHCKACNLPGWGLIKTEKGLPCEACYASTELCKTEIYGCVKCDHQIMQPRSDGKHYSDARYCQYCNP